MRLIETFGRSARSAKGSKSEGVKDSDLFASRWMLASSAISDAVCCHWTRCRPSTIQTSWRRV
jgi:hypothetical protein